MWSRLPSRFVARMLTGHTAMGLAASALIYLLSISGTLMVFHQEFARWEQPDVPEFQRMEPAAAHAAATAGLERAEEAPHHLFLGLPVEGMPRASVTVDEQQWFANAEGELVAPVTHEWAHFLEALHYYLTLPSTLGLTVVGILGVLMTALVLSGLLSHPRLFRDAFKLRLGNGRQLRETDTHNRLGVWAAPFHLVIAFTGAAIGLATLVAITVGQLHGEGDYEAYFEPIFGDEEEMEDPAPAPLADIEAALHNFERAHPELPPWFVSFHDPATTGQAAKILAKHPRRLIYGEDYQFDVDGELTGNTGLSDGPVGQQAIAAFYPLHFGSFGGLAVKAAYGILGILACIMVASGVNIWLLKRRQRGRPTPVLENAWQAVVWGTPATLALVLLATTLGVTNMGVLVGFFWLALLALTVGAMCWSHRPCRRLLRIATGALLLVGLAVKLVTSHAQLPAHAVATSLVLFGFAVWFLQAGIRESASKH